MGFGETKRVLVTGGAGFLGSFVVEKLKQRGCNDIFVHLAASVGGIGANQANSGKFLQILFVNPHYSVNNAG